MPFVHSRSSSVVDVVFCLNSEFVRSVSTFSRLIIVAVAALPLSKLLLIPFSGVGGEEGVDGVEASVLFLLRLSRKEFEGAISVLI